MRKVHPLAAAVLAGLVLTACGSGDDKPDKTQGSPAGQADAKEAPKGGAQGTMIDRAAGSWKTILKKSDIETVTIRDGHVAAKGSRLDCSGTLKPGMKKGKEAPTLTLSCKNGGDGGRGTGTVHLMTKNAKGDALAFDWQGPEGGWGGPVDSFRRVS